MIAVPVCHAVRMHPPARHEASGDAIFTIGAYTFRPSSKLFLNPRGNRLRLTEKETAILRYLYRAGQRPVSRETLLQEVWGYNSGWRSRPDRQRS
jgi:DNA-binding response OmpR family regulator